MLMNRKTTTLGGTASFAHVRKSLLARTLGLSGACAVIAATSITHAKPAEAVYYEPHGLGFRNINVQPLNVSSYWVNILDDSRGRWNSSGAGTSIVRQTTAGGKYTAKEVDEDYYGLYWPTNTRGQFPGTRCSNRVFTITINALRIRQATNDHWAWNTSTSVHEFGHALSLAHTSGASIMNTERNRSTDISPNSRDATQVVRNNTGSRGC